MRWLLIAMLSLSLWGCGSAGKYNNVDDVLALRGWHKEKLPGNSQKPFKSEVKNDDKNGLQKTTGRIEKEVEKTTITVEKEWDEISSLKGAKVIRADDLLRAEEYQLGKTEVQREQISAAETETEAKPISKPSPIAVKAKSYAINPVADTTEKHIRFKGNASKVIKEDYSNIIPVHRPNDNIPIIALNQKSRALVEMHQFGAINGGRSVRATYKIYLPEIIPARRVSEVYYVKRTK